MFETPEIDPDATDATVFKTSPTQYQLNLIGLALCAFLFMPVFPGRRPEDPLVWIPNSRLGLLSLICIGSVMAFNMLWRLIRPVTLITNGAGFVLTGGFIWSSEMQAWNDVERFFVTSAGRKERVACALKPYAERHFRARRGSSNADAIFAGFFPTDPEQVVAQLNTLRQHAVGYTPEFIDNSYGGLRADQGGGGAKVQQETIRSSRWLYVMTLAIVLVPFVLSILAEIKTGLFDNNRRLLYMLPLFVPVILGALWLAVRPPVLVLDQEGFTLTGGFTRSPKKTCWKDVQDFLVYNPPKNYLPKIAYKSRSSNPTESDLHKWATEKVLMLFFVFNADKVVNELNDYRERALGLAS